MIRKNILVIGAAGGLGGSIVENCLLNGENVFAIVKSLNKLPDDVMTQTAGVSGGVLHKYECDITNYYSTYNTINDIFNSVASVEYVYVCTGVKFIGAANDYWGSLEKTFNVNFKGVVNCIRAVEASSHAGYPIKIIVVSSMGDKHGMIGTYGYNASKAALSIFCESLQYDFWSNKKNISLQVVRPGFIQSKMNSSSFFAKIMSLTSDAAAKRVLIASCSSSFYINFPLLMNVFTILLSCMPIRIKYFVLMRLNNDK